MHVRTYLLAATLTAGLASATPALAGKLYKWVDEEGNVTYSQVKPPDRQAERMRLPSSVVRDDGAREKLDSLTDKAGEAGKDREFEENHASAMQQRKERLKKNCEIARENMRILKTSSRVQDKDADGNPYFLDETAIQSKIEATQRQIEANCG